MIVGIVQEFLEYWVYNTLLYLRVYEMEIFLYLSGVGYIDDIIKQVIANTFFYNAICYSYGHAIFFCFIFPYYCRGNSGAGLNEVPDIFFYKYGLG